MLLFIQLTKGHTGSHAQENDYTFLQSEQPVRRAIKHTTIKKKKWDIMLGPYGNHKNSEKQL